MIGKSDGQFPRGNASGNNMPLNSKVAFTETAALYDGVNKLSAIAAHLGRSQDAEHYRELASAMRGGLNSPSSMTPKTTYRSQAANALAVQFGFARPEDVPAILDWIHEDIGRQGGHFTVGSYTLPYLLETLGPRTNRRRMDGDDFSRVSGIPSYGFIQDPAPSGRCGGWQYPVSGSTCHSPLQPASLCRFRLPLALSRPGRDQERSGVSGPPASHSTARRSSRARVRLSRDRDPLRQGG